MQIQLTDNAINKVKELLSSEASEKGLRINVQEGGCAGFKYGLSFDTPHEGDETMDVNGLKVMLDATAVEKINGSTIDYVDSLEGAGFKFDNPNAQRTCGCGKSFGGC